MTSLASAGAWLISASLLFWVSWLLIAVLGPVCLLQVLVARKIFRGLRIVPLLRELEAPKPERWPRLSVIVPACNEADTIEAARQVMLQFGGKPTGAYYPTGVERAENIAKCAAKH